MCFLGSDDIVGRNAFYEYIFQNKYKIVNFKKPYFHSQTLVARWQTSNSITLLTFYVEKQEKTLKFLNFHLFSLSKAHNSSRQGSVKAGAKRSLYSLDWILNWTTFVFEREKEANPFFYLSPFIASSYLFNQSSISGLFLPQCVFHIKEERGRSLILAVVLLKRCCSK